MYLSQLPQRSVLALEGPDRIVFLQGLITNDATHLANGPLYAALLSPQGRFLHDMFLVSEGERILIDVHAGRADDLLKRLNAYKLRSKVKIEPLPEYKVAALWGEGDAPQGAIRDPRVAAMGWRFYGEVLPQGFAAGNYEHHRIMLGVPDGAQDMTIDRSLIMEFDIEALHGVSFSKGCYVGQEVTARSKFRGAVRKKLYNVHGNAALPAPGTEITLDGKPVGELKSTSGEYGLALLRHEDIQNASTALMAGDVAISHHLAEWNKAAS